MRAGERTEKRNELRDRRTALPIRRLGCKDLSAMRALNALFAQVFEDHERYAGKLPNDGYLTTLLTRPHIIVLVAEAGEALVGGLVAYVLDKLERAESEIYIYDLAVDVSHRRRGIATALIARLRALAAPMGAYVVFVQADHGDDPAIALYTKLGIREDVMHFDIAVDDAT